MNAFRFLKNIKLVAVDELHYYSGTFGRLVFFCLYPTLPLQPLTSRIAMSHRSSDAFEEFALRLEVGGSISVVLLVLILSTSQIGGSGSCHVVLLSQTLGSICARCSV